MYFFVDISEHWIFFCSIIAFFFLEYFLSSGGIFLFRFSLYLWAVFCVYLIFMTLVSGSVYFGRVSLEFSGGLGHIFFLCGVPLCGMLVRYNLFGR